MTTRASAGCPDPAVLLAVDEQVLDSALEARVRRHLDTCAGCRETAAALRDTLDRELDLDVRARMQRKVADATTPRRTVPRWTIPMGVLAAAAAVLLVVSLPDPVVPVAPVGAPATSGSPLSRVTVFHPDRPIFVAGEGAIAMRSQQSSREVLLARIGAVLDEADAGKYSEAIAALEQIERDHPSSADAPLAIGTTYLLAGRAAEAITALERGRPRATGSLVDEFDWHLAVAFVTLGTPERARARLVTVCEHGGPRSAVACAGLAEIAKPPASSSK